jgi:hypothetical protein
MIFCIKSQTQIENKLQHPCQHEATPWWSRHGTQLNEPTFGLTHKGMSLLSLHLIVLFNFRSTYVIWVLQDLFDLEDSINNFSKLFLASFYVATRCIPKNITKARVIKLLALAKLFSGIRRIAIGKVFYWLVSKIFCLQFHNAFVIHLSSH